MKFPRMNGIFVSASMLLSPVAASLAQGSDDNIDRAIEFLKESCVTGELATVEGSAGGGIRFLARGVEGSFSFTEEKVRGFLGAASDETRAVENSKIRSCMAEFRREIMNKILATGADVNGSVEEEARIFYPSGTEIQQGMPYPVLDDSIEITVQGMSYNPQARKKTARITVNGPGWGRPLYLDLSPLGTEGSFPSSAVFDYRDDAYELILDKVNVEDSSVAITIRRQ